MVDKYEKIGVKIIFGVLMAMNITLTILLLLIDWLSSTDWLIDFLPDYTAKSVSPALIID